MSLKHVKKVVSIDKLTFDYAVNIRQTNNYDLPHMKEQIVSMGRIIKPLAVREMEVDLNGKKEKQLLVLQGNRRGRAGLELWNDPSISVELKEALSKVDIIVYTDLTPSEEISLIIDHGSEKPISRTETVVAIWRLDKQFKSEAEIISTMYFALAKYSGNEKKLRDVPTEPRAKEKFLKSWLHGTVGNYVLASAKMGDFIREQFILTHRSEDKLLNEGEKVELRCSRDRITQLSQAITADKDVNKDGKGWNVDTGGEKFNALVQKFKDEDAGLAEAEAKVSRPSVKLLKEKADVYKSPAIRTALLVAAGELAAEGGKQLLDLDDRLTLLQMKLEVLQKNEGSVKDEGVKKLVHAILNGGPAASVEEAMKPFLV